MLVCLPWTELQDRSLLAPSSFLYNKLHNGTPVKVVGMVTKISVFFFNTYLEEKRHVRIKVWRKMDTKLFSECGGKWTSNYIKFSEGNGTARNICYTIYTIQVTDTWCRWNSMTSATHNISTRLFDRITCLSAYKTRGSQPPLSDANHFKPHEPVVHSEFIKPPQIYHIISHRLVPYPVTRTLLSLNPSLEIIPIEVHTKPVQPFRVFGFLFFRLHLFPSEKTIRLLLLYGWYTVCRIGTVSWWFDILEW